MTIYIKKQIESGEREREIESGGTHSIEMAIAIGSVKNTLE